MVLDMWNKLQFYIFDLLKLDGVKEAVLKVQLQNRYAAATQPLPISFYKC